MNYRLGIALISVILMGGAGTVRSTEDQEGSSGIRDESQPVKGHENMADLHAYMLDRLLAQSDDSDSGGDTFRRMHQMRGRQGMGPDADRRKYLEQFRTLKLLELLNLKEDQEIEFLTAFRNIRKQGQSFEQEKRQLLESLSADLAAGRVDKHRIEVALEDYFQIAKRQQEAHMHFIDQIKSILTPEQVAKFLLFDERFERELLEHVREFRNRGMDGRP